MPEYRECWCHWKHLRWLRWNGYKDKSWRVQGLWVDLTGPEAARHKHDTVYKLGPNSRFCRGQNHNQTHLWPQAWAAGAPGEKQSLSQLALDNENCIRWTARSIILDFGPLILKLSYLTHTSVQVYSRELWETRIKPEPAKNRNAKVALAIEFPEHVLVFLSKDNLVQPEWVTRDEGHIMFKEPNPPDVYDDFDSRFLTRFTGWLAKRRATRASRNAFAYTVFEDSEMRSIWHGVGVYTSTELFPRSGVNPFLTEAEVFDNPSRTARLCAAFYSFAASARENDALWHDVVRPAIDNEHLLLAPSATQRQRYSRWLNVWAQGSMKVSKRMFRLAKDYQSVIVERGKQGDNWYRDDPNQTGLYDAFEPYLIREALDKFPFLHALIFGDDQSTSNDPLTQYFRNEGLGFGKNDINFLKPDMYETDNLYLEEPKFWATRPTLAYEIGESKRKIWTIIPPFPANCSPNSKTTPSTIQVNELKDVWDPEEKQWYLFRSALLLKNIAKTNDVSIGPLEYYGNAQIVEGTHDIRHIFAFRGDLGDPTTSDYYADRIVRRRSWLSTDEATRKKSGASQSSKKQRKDDMKKLEERKARNKGNEDLARNSTPANWELASSHLQALENSSGNDDLNDHEWLPALETAYESDTLSFLEPTSDVNSEWPSSIPSSRASTPPPTDLDGQGATREGFSNHNMTPFHKKRKRRTSADSMIIAQGLDSEDDEDEAEGSTSLKTSQLRRSRRIKV